MQQFVKQVPRMVTARLILREIMSIDYTVIHRLNSDPDIILWRGVAPMKEIDDVKQLIFSWRQAFALNRGVRWGIELDGKLIGTCGAKQISLQHKRAEISYDLLSEYWNRGIMTEALTAMTQILLTEFNLQSIEANIDPSHLASAKVLTKLGFTPEALFKNNYYHERWWDSQIWSKHRTS
jgi:[ribosomal protein S5]-alanine N-acetyltransferase